MSNFLMASPGYLKVTPGAAYYGSTNAVTVTPLGQDVTPEFYVVRYAFHSLAA